METIPREISKTDYYAIEHVKKFVPEIITESHVEMVAVERIVTRTEYIPVERYPYPLFRKIVHYPEAPLAVGGAVIAGRSCWRSRYHYNLCQKLLCGS